ncbi:MAG: hypothetical protein QOH96_2448 [Blastocatellia bacterium]|jgi:hypothetical protein|nr:hypothetical protein [Blastocatellia bacterium]
MLLVTGILERFIDSRERFPLRGLIGLYKDKETNYG